MANIKTRISLKYDTLDNWQESTLKLNKGELAIAVIPTPDPANKQLPPVMFKVGDGEHTFKELGNNWASALAADVYDWAKAATKPSYTPAEVGADVAGAAATAEANAKAYVNEKIGAIPPQAEYTLETGETDGSLVLKKDGAAVGDPAVVKGWATLLTKAQKGIDDAAKAQAAATKAQGDIDAYKVSNDAALAAVKKTADAAQTEAQVNAKISAHNSAEDAHSDIRQSVTALAEKVSGRATAYVYKNKSDAAYTAAIGDPKSFVVGDTIYFTGTNILDEWVTKVNAVAPYYAFQEIETEKPSFDGYVKGENLTNKKIIFGAGGSNIIASTYGVSETLTATDAANLTTSKAIADYVTDQMGAKQNKLNEDQLAAVNSGITADKVGNYDNYATTKQNKIDASNPLSADLVSGLGTAAKKDVDTTVSATSENLPTSKAVASYVGEEIGKITIPTVNNAALKDASGATIFTANASADVEILLIDCGNASGWDA